MLSGSTRRPNALEFLTGGGEMGERIRAFDWSQTAIGPAETWSPTLRTVLRMVLVNRFPQLLWWGPDYIQFYNDPYIPIPGSKHPDVALGRPARECWPEIWHVIGPLIDRPFSGGDPTWNDDIYLELRRSGFLEETHFTIAYSPVPDDTAPGGIGGVLATVHEITGKVVGERRVVLLRDLGNRLSHAHTVEEVLTIAVDTLASHDRDVAFAESHVSDGHGGSRLVAATANAPRRAWDLGDEVSVVDGATILPIGRAGHLVAGISEKLPFDTLYRDFFELLRTQIASAVAVASAFEEEKRRAEALAEIDRAKTAFFSNVSHEFRTPLTLMLGPVEDLLTERKGELPESVQDQLETVSRNGLRLLRLVNTLLDFSRIEAGRSRATYQPTDLAHFTRDLASLFQSACDRAGLRLVLDAQALGEPVYVDRDFWEKIVLNLLSNAFKFTFEGEIEVALRAADGHAELTVRDSGTGIPEHEMPRLFERFHRVHNARGRTHEGSGIGLALVQELVTLHGGTIRAASVLDQGTAFTVRIPFGRGHLPADAVGEAETSAPAAARAAPFVEEALRWLPGEAREAEEEIAPLRDGDPPVAGAVPVEARPRVLVADDNADMREYISRLLAGRYRVETVTDGVAALAAARRQKPDLIVSDVMMPQVDGFELLRVLRDDESLRSIPVILLSARAGEESRLDGMQAGADDYLVKPFSARELIARTDACLKLSRLRGELTESLRASEARLWALVSASTDVVYRMSADWSEMRQLRGREFIADTDGPSSSWLEKYVHPDDRAQVLKAIRKAIREKGMFAFEHRVIRVDGSLGWTFSRAVPLLDGQGEIVEWIGAAIDVTERRQAEALLRDADRRKDEFLATLSHELRNPLAPMRNSLELLRRLDPHVPAAVAARATLHRQMDHMVRLLDDLLDMSRISGGKFDLRRERIELAPLLRHAVEAARMLPEYAGQSIHLELPDEPIHLMADPVRLAQVFGNLLSNACRYSDRGCSVVCSIRRAGGEVVVTVRDDGIGIAPDRLESIFDMFAQIDRSLERSRGGLGIGLHLVKQLVQMHGGSVTASSEGPGSGTEFVVRLPVLVEVPSQPEASAKDSAPASRGGRSRSILIVDDNADSAQSLSMLLTLSGHRTETAFDGVEAVEKASRIRPDLVVMDIGLPKMNGYDAGRAIRSGLAGRPLVLVALSGYGTEEDRRKSTEAGFDSHLVKPVAYETLTALIEQFERSGAFAVRAESPANPS